VRKRKDNFFKVRTRRKKLDDKIKCQFSDDKDTAFDFTFDFDRRHLTVQHRRLRSETDAVASGVFKGRRVWGAVRKNIISDRFSTKTAISAHI